MTRPELFSKYKNSHKIFVETGTHFGDSVDVALNLGFEKIISVETVEEFYNTCVLKFQSENKVILYKGTSKDNLSEMMKNINEPVLFFLDAHFSGASSECFDELEIIKTILIKNNTIIIDDLCNFDIDDLKNRLLEINPDYEFFIESATDEITEEIYPNFILVAKYNGITL